jgi:hypothetical protein
MGTGGLTNQVVLARTEIRYPRGASSIPFHKGQEPRSNSQGQIGVLAFWRVTDLDYGLEVHPTWKEEPCKKM